MPPASVCRRVYPATVCWCVCLDALPRYRLPARPVAAPVRVCACLRRVRARVFEKKVRSNVEGGQVEVERRRDVASHLPTRHPRRGPEMATPQGEAGALGGRPRGTDGIRGKVEGSEIGMVGPLCCAGWEVVPTGAQRNPPGVGCPPGDPRLLPAELRRRVAASPPREARP